MSDFFNNEVVQGVLVSLIGLLVLGIFGWLKFKRDEKIVTDFLNSSGIETPHDLRTTRAISSATTLSEKRIRKVCGRSSRVRRDHKEKGSWILS